MRQNERYCSLGWVDDHDRSSVSRATAICVEVFEEDKRAVVLTAAMRGGCMNTPTTTKDERYSDPKALPVSWSDTCAVLASAELFWLSTVRASGQPHVTPLVSVWVDDALHFTTGDKEQKAANLRANARVALTTGCNDWRGGIDVVVEGRALLVTDQVVLERLCEAWRLKWDGSWQYSARDGHMFHSGGFEVLTYSVAPSKVLAFAKGSFCHTVHRFEAP
jgi:general stress protein 26